MKLNDYFNCIFKDKNSFIIDNLLTKNEEDYIENILLGVNFPYYFNESNFTVANDQQQKFSHLKNVKDYNQLCHQFYKLNDENNTIKVSNYCKIVDDLVNNILIKLNLQDIIIRRAKANLQQQFTDNKSEYHNTPHYDSFTKHYVCIYYVNDSDGDTLFFDNEKECNITNRITPKKGRFLFFKGETLHTGQHPIKSSTRVVININFEENN